MARSGAWAAGGCAAAALLLGGALRRLSRDFPPLSQLPDTPFVLQDATLAGGGLRAAAADLAWIEMLQYAAGHGDGFADSGFGYSRLPDLARRVVRLDPAFHSAYTYAAGILAWFHGVDRPDDAAAILEEGMRRDPGHPTYALYIAAIAYKKKGDTDAMVRTLDAACSAPDASVFVRELLANVHSERGEYGRALEIWNAILDDPTLADQHPRAELEIGKIRAKMR